MVDSDSSCQKEAVYKYFDRVAKLIFVKDKWIDFDFYIKSLRVYTDNENEVMPKLSNHQIKIIMSK